jgi:hypothetical protein
VRSLSHVRSNWRLPNCNLLKALWLHRAVAIRYEVSDMVRGLVDWVSFKVRPCASRARHGFIHTGTTSSSLVIEMITYDHHLERQGQNVTDALEGVHSSPKQSLAKVFCIPMISCHWSLGWATSLCHDIFPFLQCCMYQWSQSLGYQSHLCVKTFLQHTNVWYQAGYR